MEPVVFVAVIGGLILLFLIIGAPLKPVRFLGQGIIKIIIGALFLFFLNTLGIKWAFMYLLILLLQQLLVYLEFLVVASISGH